MAIGKFIATLRLCVLGISASPMKGRGSQSTPGSLWCLYIGRGRVISLSPWLSHLRARDTRRRGEGESTMEHIRYHFIARGHLNHSSIFLGNGTLRPRDGSDTCSQPSAMTAISVSSHRRPKKSRSRIPIARQFPMVEFNTAQTDGSRGTKYVSRHPWTYENRVPTLPNTARNPRWG